MMQPICLDVESFPDVFGVGLMDYHGRVPLWFTSCGIGRPLAEFRPWLDAIKSQEAIFLTVNGLSYDMPMMRYVYDGEYDPAELKQRSDTLIDSDDYNLRRSAIAGELHCDLLAMHGGKELVAGSKEMAVKGNLRWVGETPVAFDQAYTSEAERDAIFRRYNRMDLETIVWAYSVSTREIAMRLALMEEFGVDVLSEADAGVADKIMRRLLYPLRLPRRSEITSWTLE